MFMHAALIIDQTWHGTEMRIVPMSYRAAQSLVDFDFADFVIEVSM